MVAHACNPSYVGGRGWGIAGVLGCSALCLASRWLKEWLKQHKQRVVISTLPVRADGSTGQGKGLTELGGAAGRDTSV